MLKFKKTLLSILLGIATLLSAVNPASADSGASLWKLTGGYLLPVGTFGLQIPSLGSSGNPLLTVDANGKISTTTGSTGGGTWGSITGTLSAQTDLQSALDAKLAITSFGTYFYNLFHATTTDALPEGSTNKYYTDTRVNSYISASSTIPKTYTDNTWLGNQTFSTMTNGSLLFAGSSGLLSQNNQSLFWDNSLKNLLISDTLGSELITNGTFTGNATGWSLGSGWTYSSNTVVHSANGTNLLQPSTALTTIIAGYEYQYSIDISSLTVGSTTVTVGGVTLGTFSANGTYTGKFVATSNANLVFTPTNTSRFTVDNVSIKRLSGGTVSAGTYYGDTFHGLKSALGATTPTDSFIAENGTSATSGSVQVSPSFRWRGKAWNTSSSQSKNIDFLAWVQPQSNTQGSGIFKLQVQHEGTAAADLFSIDPLAGGKGVTFSPYTALSNSTPGTTRNITIENTGTNSWVDFNFSGTRRASFGADSNGYLHLYSNGGDIRFYGSSGSFLAEIYSGGIYNYGGSFNTGSLTAGQANTTPPSTFTNYGSTGLKVTKVTTSGTLTGDYTQVLCDTSESICTGTPSNSCGSHGDQTSCEQYNSHGGCTWNAGSSCGNYNYEYGMSSCGATTGCSIDTTSCSGAGDQYSCESQDDSYGGGCTWDTNYSDCSGLDESTCGFTSGCSLSYSYCSWDSGMSYCNGGAGCNVIGDESTCNSTVDSYLGCSGSYPNGNTCNGSYNTGNCSGTYGASCSGTASCSGISTGSCTSETGCSLTTGLNITMPSDSAGLERTYWLKKISSSGTLTILPNTGQTIDGASSLVIATSSAAVMLSYYRESTSCGGLDESTCNTTSGCSASYPNCTWDNESNVCGGGGSCSGYGDQSSCESGTYYNSCGGSYISSKKWYIMSGYKLGN